MNLSCKVTVEGVPGKTIAATHWYVVPEMKLIDTVTPEGALSKEATKSEVQVGH